MVIAKIIAAVVTFWIVISCSLPSYADCLGDCELDEDNCQVESIQEMRDSYEFCDTLITYGDISRTSRALCRWETRKARRRAWRSCQALLQACIWCCPTPCNLCEE